MATSRYSPCPQQTLLIVTCQPLATSLVQVNVIQSFPIERPTTRQIASSPQDTTNIYTRQSCHHQLFHFTTPLGILIYTCFNATVGCHIATQNGRVTGAVNRQFTWMQHTLIVLEVGGYTQLHFQLKLCGHTGNQILGIHTGTKVHWFWLSVQSHTNTSPSHDGCKPKGVYKQHGNRIGIIAQWSASCYMTLFQHRQKTLKSQLQGCHDPL